MSVIYIILPTLFINNTARIAKNENHELLIKKGSAFALPMMVDEGVAELLIYLAVILEFTAVVASGTSLLRTVFLPFLTQKTTAEHGLYRAE
jgi:hypothetical protein